MKTTDQALEQALAALKEIVLAPEFDPDDPGAQESMREIAAAAIEKVGPVDKLLGVNYLYAPLKKATERKPKRARKS